MAEGTLQGFGNLAVKTPTEREWDVQAAKQQREMGGTFDKVFSPEGYGEGVHRMHQKRNETAALMARLSPKPWSVINMMPSTACSTAGRDRRDLPAGNRQQIVLPTRGAATSRAAPPQTNRALLRYLLQ